MLQGIITFLQIYLFNSSWDDLIFITFFDRILKSSIESNLILRNDQKTDIVLVSVLAA